MAVHARCLFLVFVASLFIPTAGTVSPGYFMGGTLSFHYVNTSSAHVYKFHITMITGWELGHGPCGPGCSYADVGKDTRPSRDRIIQSSGNPAIFGDFTKEMQVVNGQTTHLAVNTITTEVNQNIAGRVSAVSTSLNWEQQIAHVEVDIDTRNAYTDVSLVGHSWKMFDLNHPSSPSGTINSGVYSIQTKIHPKIRSDTLKPNSSPLVLYKPVYMVELDKVNKIRLTASDNDGDVIRCRKARNVEIQGIGEVDDVDISQDCVITVSAMQSNGYRDNSKGVIGLAVDDYNRHPIQMEDERFEPYDQRGLSSSVLDFMIWVVASMPVPEFVSPTPQSQQVFTVYAGSKLIIPLAAKPNTNSVPGTHVTKFNVVSLPNLAVTLTPAQDDPQRHQDNMVLSQIEWRSSHSDTGDFIIQAVAIDSAGYESQDRSYKIEVRALPQVEDTGVHTGFLFDVRISDQSYGPVWMTNCKCNPSQKILQPLQSARSKAQQTARHCADGYWQQLYTSTENASDAGNTRGIYEDIYRATGVPTKKPVPLKTKTWEVITDQEKQMGRWVEHHLELYSKESSVSQEALNAIEDLPVLMVLHAEPTVEELSKAIDALSGMWKGTRRRLNTARSYQEWKAGMPRTTPHASLPVLERGQDTPGHS